VLLAIFGRDYTQGAGLLRVLLAAQLPRLVVVLGVAVHLAAGRGIGVAGPQAATATLAVVLALVLPNEFAFGVGMLIAQGALALITVLLLAKSRGRR
jgi:hypothetical protein